MSTNIHVFQNIFMTLPVNFMQKARKTGSLFKINFLNF